MPQLVKKMKETYFSETFQGLKGQKLIISNGKLGLPTHVFSQSRRYHPKHSYTRSVLWHEHVDLNGVPKIPKMAVRHPLGWPAHFSVELSIAHACSYCSRRDLKK